MIEFVFHDVKPLEKSGPLRPFLPRAGQRLEQPGVIALRKLLKRFISDPLEFVQVVLERLVTQVLGRFCTQIERKVLYCVKSCEASVINPTSPPNSRFAGYNPAGVQLSKG